MPDPESLRAAEALRAWRLAEPPPLTRYRLRAKAREIAAARGVDAGYVLALERALDAKPPAADFWTRR